MPRPVALLGHNHICPAYDGKPHVGGPVIAPGQVHVRFNGIPVATEGGTCLCTGLPGPDQMTKGSSHVRINGRGVMRVGDQTAHGGRIAMGVPGLRAD